MSEPENYPGNPDFSDPLVWDMLDRNHMPQEITTTRVDGKSFSMIRCEQDGQIWPCPIRLRLNDTDQPSRFAR